LTRSSHGRLHYIPRSRDSGALEVFHQKVRSARNRVFHRFGPTYGSSTPSHLGEKDRRVYKRLRIPKLPTELRFKIWEELVAESRIVEVYITDGHFKGESTYTFSSNTPVPVCLHINQEPHQVALKHYELSFASSKDGTYRGKHTIYFNSSNDVAYFKIDSLFNLQVNRNLSLEALIYLNSNSSQKPLTSKRLKKIAFPVDVAQRSDTAIRLCDLPSLTDVILLGDEVEARQLREDDDKNVRRSRRRKSQTKLSIMEPGESAAPDWSSKADTLRKEFAHRKNDRYLKKLPQHIISVKILVRED
jgi:hypothetical protein